MEQLRRQFDDAVAAQRKAEAKSDALEKKVEELLCGVRESRILQEPRAHTVTEPGPSSSHGEPSGSTSKPGPSISQTGPYTSSNDILDGRPSSLAQSDMDSIAAENLAKEE
ncbi:hypothetical protein BS17DRAFT_789043 [Gyrodon lividus]|nr:hypothetical protein BS17DRAFT_789043 [Gyrodon lividus]